MTSPLKRRLPLDEKMALLRKERAKIPRKSDTFVPAETWTSIPNPCARYKVLLRNPGGLTNSVTARHPSRIQVFKRICTETLMDKLIAQHVNDFPEMTHEKVMKYFALRMYIQASAHPSAGDGRSPEPLRAAFTECKRELDEELGTPLHSFNCRRFKALHAKFLLTPDILHDLCDAFQSSITYGEYVSLDEKLRRYTGLGPFIRKVIKKPDKIGHWITQVCVHLSSSNLPYCTYLRPVLTSPAYGTTTPVKSLVKDCVEHILRTTPLTKCPVIVMDSHYLCKESRGWLLKNDVPYIASVRSDRFPVFKPMLTTVKKHKGWRAKVHTGTGEVAVHTLDPVLGKKSLLTNCLVQVAGQVQFPEDPPGWHEYNYMFSGCDVFNRILAKKYWPFRHMKWQSSLSDFFFTVMLVNSYMLYLTENRNSDRVECWYTFCRSLSVEILSSYL